MVSKIQSITDIIRSRYSCRGYQNRPVSQNILDELLDFIHQNSTGFLGTKSRVQFGQVQSGLSILRSLNTYGFIKGTDEFLVCAATKIDDQLQQEEFGYVVEKIILKATELGLATCWMGGTFRKSIFSKLVELKDDESLPAVIAIGYPADKKRRTDKMIRKAAGSDHRRPWDRLFYLQNFETPLTPENAGIFSTALEMVRLAPSASNKQPWKIVVDNNNAHFYLRRTPGYKDQSFLVRTGKEGDLQRIDIGIAISHFELTMNENKCSGSWTVSDPGIPLPDDLTEYKITWVLESALSKTV